MRLGGFANPALDRPVLPRDFSLLARRNALLSASAGAFRL